MIHYTTNNQYAFYTLQISLTDNAEPRTIYSDESESFNEMLRNFPRLANLVVKPITPSTEQSDRLEVLNSITAENKEQWNSECILFVQFGVIKEDTPCDFLSEIRLDYEEITQKALLYKLSEEFDTALTAHLDSVANQRRYDNRITCALRAGFAGVFQEEGKAFAEWMDACNIIAYTTLAEVKAKTAPVPESTEAFIAGLPKLVWPPEAI